MTPDATQIEHFLRDQVFSHFESQALAANLAGRVALRTLVSGDIWSPDRDTDSSACLVYEGLLVVRRRHADPARDINVAVPAGNGFALPLNIPVADDADGSSCVEIIAALPCTLLVLPAREYESAATKQMPPFEALLAPLGTWQNPAAENDVSTPVEAPGRSGHDIAGDTRRMPLMQQRVDTLMSTDLAVAAPGTTIENVARLMRERRVSCIPIVDDGRLRGIVTEADFGARVVAEGRSGTAPVASIMSADLFTVRPDDTLFDVLQLITHEAIAHVPVTEGDRLIGLITQTDLIRCQTGSSVYMVNDIAHAGSGAAIAAIVAEIPRLLLTLVDSGGSTRQIGTMLTSIADASTRRLLELAESELGPAPVPYLWLACGSQGREEQTGVSDQDNCLILHDDYDAQLHGAWFEQLARIVCDGLNAAGYVYCPGDMMATNPDWRQPQHVWRGYFRQWITRPQPMAQMLASVMFDLRPICGDHSLYRSVQSEVLSQARANSIFVAHMVNNSLGHRPPLGLFGRLAVERRGEYRHRVDLKHGGVVPIVDLARVHALTALVRDVNTLERLQNPGEHDSLLSEQGRRDLKSAYDFIAMTRLRHQAQQVRASLKVDNYVSPRALSTLQQEHLRESLLVIRDIQSALQSRVASLG